jgi:hypothetical protein
MSTFIWLIPALGCACVAYAIHHTQLWTTRVLNYPVASFLILMVGAGLVDLATDGWVALVIANIVINIIGVIITSRWLRWRQAALVAATQDEEQS